MCSARCPVAPSNIYQERKLAWGTAAMPAGVGEHLVYSGIPLYTSCSVTRPSRQRRSQSGPLDTSVGGSKTWLDRLWGTCG